MESNSTKRQRKTLGVTTTLLVIVIVFLTVGWVTLADDIPNREEAARVSAEIVQLKNSRDALIEEIGTLNANRDGLEIDLTEIRELIAKRENLKREIDSLVEEKESRLNERDRRDQDLRNVIDEVKVRESNIQSLTRRETNLKKSIDDLSKLQEGMETFRREVEDLTNEKSGLESKITVLMKKHNELRGNVEYLEGRGGDIEAKISEREEYVRKLELELNDVEVNLKTKQEMVKTARNELIQEQANLDQAKLDIQKLSNRINNLESIESNVRKQLNELLVQLEAVGPTESQNGSEIQ